MVPGAFAQNKNTVHIAVYIGGAIAGAGFLVTILLSIVGCMFDRKHGTHPDPEQPRRNAQHQQQQPPMAAPQQHQAPRGHQAAAPPGVTPANAGWDNGSAGAGAWGQAPPKGYGYDSYNVPVQGQQMAAAAQGWAQGAMPVSGWGGAMPTGKHQAW
ncbi:hypothetical protein HXX76_010791 [Chlamydomonas incerta]|uniref:Uncharacterized protein n=1 Tax=Chlamydomonas incerta TaxID=51695 RepID=A0A835SPS0_CHLIN|nr:hypothetical protein HXX76_010791 [Chlamydomonas incerta]|eukprot:KAG2429556.1 hypothetical protein HXX76_010791 [Chlamydomonas incerta]